MIKEILILGSFFLAGIVVACSKDFIKKTIVKVFTKKPKQSSRFGCYVGKQYYVKEPFSGPKFVQGLNPFTNPVLWGKSVIILIRQLLVVLLIASIVGGGIFAYGYWKGQTNKPVIIDMTKYGDEMILELDKEGNVLHIDKTGHVYVEDKEGNRLRTIKVSDIPALKKALRPIAFQLKPCIVTGVGVSKTGADWEVGGGVSFLRYWRGSVEAFLTNMGAYLGTSYKLDQIHLDNMSVGIGGGMGYDGDPRVIVYGRVTFGDFTDLFGGKK